jgi:pantothenate kinase
MICSAVLALSLLQKIMSVQAIASQLAGDVSALYKGRRLLIAIAGVPGSGKTTLSKHLVSSLNDERNLKAVYLPMDGSVQ